MNEEIQRFFLGFGSERPEVCSLELAEPQMRDVGALPFSQSAVEEVLKIVARVMHRVPGADWDNFAMQAITHVLQYLLRHLLRLSLCDQRSFSGGPPIIRGEIRQNQRAANLNYGGANDRPFFQPRDCSKHSPDSTRRRN